MTTKYRHTRNGHGINIHPSLHVRDHASILTTGKNTLIPKDEAPRAAAALLRAAGWGKPKEHGRTPLDNSIDGALSYIDAVVQHQDREAAKAAEEAAIREEARELFEVANKTTGGVLWDLLPQDLVQLWINVARQARSIHERTAK